MAAISFNDAKIMVEAGNDWLSKVSDLIKGTSTQLPVDIYDTQKLAFKVYKSDLEALLNAETVVGILGYETAKNSLTVILVGLDKDDKPNSQLLPRQTWPRIKSMAEMEDVVNDYLDV